LHHQEYQNGYDEIDFEDHDQFPDPEIGDVIKTREQFVDKKVEDGIVCYCRDGK
jgi:hypothetical protein